jgi:hypothetical protein
MVAGDVMAISFSKIERSFYYQDGRANCQPRSWGQVYATRQRQPREGIMKFVPMISTALVLALLSGLSACKKADEPIGPAQKAGAAIDQAGERVAAKLHEPIDKAREVGGQVAEAAKDTEKQINQATEDASRGIDKATEEVGKKVERAGEKIQESVKK